MEQWHKIKGWDVIKTLKEVHVVPSQDLREHGLFSSCLCQPFLWYGVWVHNSYDGREFNEKDNINVMQ